MFLVVSRLVIHFDFDQQVKLRTQKVGCLERNLTIPAIDFNNGKIWYSTNKYNLLWLFCFRFSSTRWIEDESVAHRVITLWESIVKLIKNWLGRCKSSRPKDNKSYETLVKYHTDVMIPVSLHFFKHAASILKEFSKRFFKRVFQKTHQAFSNQQTTATFFSSLIWPNT